MRQSSTRYSSDKPSAAACARGAGGGERCVEVKDNYYHLSPHIRARVLCAGVRARYVFLTGVTVTVGRNIPNTLTDEVFCRCARVLLITLMAHLKSLQFDNDKCQCPHYVI